MGFRSSAAPKGQVKRSGMIAVSTYIMVFTPYAPVFLEKWA